MQISKLSNFFIAVISIVVILIYGQELLIPFIFALLLWFIVRQCKKQLDKIAFIKKYIPSGIKTVLVSVFLFGILSLAANILTENINDIAQSYYKYESNIDKLINTLNTTLDINIMDKVEAQVQDFDFGSILGSILNSITDILGSAFMILLYTIFVFLEESNFKNKIHLLFKEEEKYEAFNGILTRIERSVAKYLGLKTFVSFITSFLSFIVLQIIGVDSPVFWSFLILILNFIPNVGSLAATVFPAIYCLLQFGGYEEALIVLALVGSIQGLVGNFIEPKIMGNSMNISALVTILSLTLWGAIWGITGMILSVPITMIMILIFSQFDSTRGVAILLSEKGIIDEKESGK